MVCIIATEIFVNGLLLNAYFLTSDFQTDRSWIWRYLVAKSNFLDIFLCDIYISLEWELLKLRLLKSPLSIFWLGKIIC